MRSRRELAVGLRDFVNNSANVAKEKAVTAYEAKQLERQQMAELAQQRWQVQQARSAQFRPVKNIGQVAIDHANRFFLVRNATGYMRPAPRKVSKARIGAALMSAGLSEVVVAAVKSSTKASDKIFSFDELVGYELLEDDSVVSAGTTATVASARSSLFGTRAYGASASAQVGMQKKVVEHLVLRIDTNDVEYPCVMITYISRPTVVSSNNYRFAFSQAQQTMSALGAILRQREQEVPQAEPAPVQQIVVNQTSAPNDMELLKQLKELLDAGIVTEEEFQAKKAQILGL